MSERARKSHLQWVRLGDMRVSPKAQREFRKAHAESIAAEFDIEAVGFIVVSLRDGIYWIIDGQHRAAALRLVGFEDGDLLECECYEGYTEAEEAELFLRRDERKRIGTFDRFRISLVAGRDTESDIERIVRAHGYKIAQSRSDGCIGSVAALRFVYTLGPDTLARTVNILGAAFAGSSDAFGEHILKGMALVCQRYNGALDDERVITKLSGIRGGPTALVRRAHAVKLKTGQDLASCAASAIVDYLNSGRGGGKLDSWWL